MKKLLLGLVLGSGLTFGVSVFAQQDLGATSTPVIVPPPILSLDTQFQNCSTDLSDKNNLVSKYAMELDALKAKAQKYDTIQKIISQ